MRTLLLTTMAAAFLMNAGCAQESSNSAAPVIGNSSALSGLPSAPTPVNSSLPSGSYESGATVALTTSVSKLSRMFFNSVPNNPQNVQINIDLSRQSEAVIINYYDNGRVIEAAFGGKHPYSRVTGTIDSGWTTHNGNPVWKGFFQDTYGAIVVVIDSTLNTGDGTPAQFVGGKVFFLNFSQYAPNNPYQGSEKMCWEITLGPYDCRTFLVNGNIVFGSSLYPNNVGPTQTKNGNYYQELGSFTGLSRAAAGLPEQ